MRALVTGTALLSLVAGCASADSQVSSDARAALTTTTTSPATTTTTTPSGSTSAFRWPPCTEQSELESLAPRPIPAPGAPDEGVLAQIRRDGLVVGVDENTRNWAQRNPKTKELEGLEIDLVHNIADRLGAPRVVLHSVVTATKNKVVEDHKVDLTASSDSISCERKKTVAFSAEYYTAQHKLLVRNGSGITGKQDLGRRRVCVTEGSSSVDLLPRVNAKAIPYEVPTRTDCLVALQQGRADAYLGHDTFLWGMYDQDHRNTTVLPENLGDQHYGIAIAKDHPELVRAVNQVLADMCDDESLQRLADKWLAHAGDTRAEVPCSPEYLEGT
jgi:polar amino acid transport system substrate-binding protein